MFAADGTVLEHTWEYSAPLVFRLLIGAASRGGRRQQRAQLGEDELQTTQIRFLICASGLTIAGVLGLQFSSAGLL